ncbi:MAG: hypothetical protein ACLFR7_11805 [Opitutales bacterium]
MKDADKLSALYGTWCNRLNHLENTRHALLALLFAVVGYVVKEVVGREGPPRDPLWLTILLGGLFFCFIHLLLNLFLKALRISRELMKIEYALRLDTFHPSIAYFSGRRGRDKRRGFRLLGYTPDLVVVLFFIFFAAECSARAEGLAFLPPLIAAVAFVAHGVLTYRAIQTAIEQKDADDLARVPLTPA